MSVMYTASVGAEGHLRVAPDAAYDFGQGDFTIAAMIVTGTGGTVVARRDPGDGAGGGFSLAIDGDGGIAFATVGSEGRQEVKSDPTAVLEGEAHGLIAMRESGTLRLFLDGNELPVTASGDAPAAVDVSNDQPLTIGADDAGDPPGRQFVGTVMNVGLWSIALAGEALTRAGFGYVHENDPGLQGCWWLDRSGADLSQNKNPAEIVGDVAYVPCVDGLWTTGANKYAFCQLSNTPSAKDLEELADADPIEQKQTVEVPAGSPSMFVSIMALQDEPAFPMGATMTISDPEGRIYDKDVNDEMAWVRTKDGQPWTAAFVDPLPGNWTVTVTAQATTGFMLQVQTAPTAAVVETIVAALDPFYGPNAPARSHLDPGDLAWWEWFAYVAVAVVVGVVVAVITAPVLGPVAVVAGLAAFAVVGMIEASYLLGKVDHSSLVIAGHQVGGLIGVLVSPQTVLLIDASGLGGSITKRMYDERQKLLYPVVDLSPFKARKRVLARTDDTRTKVNFELTQFDAGYVSASGHGNPAKLFGWLEEEAVLRVGEYEPKEAKGKIFHMLACLCGYKDPSALGQQLVASGAYAFFGYAASYLLWSSQEQLFCDCDVEIDRQLIAGKTCKEALEATKGKYESALRQLRDNGQQDAAADLEHNLKNLVGPDAPGSPYGNPEVYLDTKAPPPAMLREGAPLPA